MHLRKLDQLREIGDEFNNAFAFLQSAAIEDRNRLKEIVARLKELQANLDGESAEKISAIISELRKIGASLKIE